MCADWFGVSVVGDSKWPRSRLTSCSHISHRSCPRRERQFATDQSQHAHVFHLRWGTYISNIADLTIATQQSNVQRTRLPDSDSSCCSSSASARSLSRLRNDRYCVGWGIVKLLSLTHSRPISFPPLHHVVFTQLFCSFFFKTFHSQFFLQFNLIFKHSHNFHKTPQWLSDFVLPFKGTGVFRDWHVVLLLPTRVLGS